MKPGKLILETGEIFDGFAPDWQTKTTFGEIVFNTGMTGYEETLTDPSYSGQILTFTYPIIGNYGVSKGLNFESEKIHAHGVICQNIFDAPAHHAGIYTFLNWLKDHQVPILLGVDTRELTKILRHHGVVASALIFENETLLTNSDISLKFPNFLHEHLVKKTSCSKAVTHGNGKLKIILVDCGLKRNILNNLLKFDVTVKQVPFNYDYTNEEYDGVVLSNGPGDPKQCIETIEVLKKALEKNQPIFGICLGSQLMALAVNANTYKLKFGHRGQNQPCINTANNLCYLTAQNHGYAIDETTLPLDWQVTFKHLNDNTVSGIKHLHKPFSAVQFHPEAAAGPHDTFYLFEEFIKQVANS
ncbi:MAG TPA: glutamine-hydrolyzing carbamoyl-phosphate synthase small subunit [Burkholderiales bacterium]|nr:glutamine-hydrolyzing carbamoyl-phosphate synthase small subunit [Burkholderiales bacterium]